MKLRVALVFVGLLGMALVAAAGTPGIFQGSVVEAPNHREAGWMYVAARNGSVRRVGVAGAVFAYDDDVPASARRSPVPQLLPAGTRVRVTAEQNAAGEWRASRVEILENAGRSAQR